MKVLVPVKRVVDYNVKVRVKPDGSGVELANVKMSMNPFDEIAVEEALRMREAGTADEVIAVSIGPAKSEDTIRTALAMGADRGVLVETDELTEPLTVAKILKSVVETEGADLVIAGKQAIDDDAGQTYASEIKVNGDSAEVTREVDGGMQTINVKMPMVATTDLRLNEPRFASLPNIMKAKKKPIDKKTVADLGIDTTPRLEIITTEEPETRQAGVIVGSVDELVDKLKNEAGVL